MSVSLEQIIEILTRMQAAGVVSLTASGPGWSLQLRLPEEMRSSTPTSTATPQMSIAMSPSVGMLIRQHPLQREPATSRGQVVAHDEILAFVAAGLLYRPVTAPVAGQVVDCLVEHGELVEFGTPLFRIAPALHQGDGHAD
ncbi:MAG: hypothetical protein JSR91_21015 [Proteobacteria bacterium]|nr:hypothetical protein [Pseudomonadota bacterium]